MVQRLVAVLGVGVVDPSEAVIRADDPGVTRGDGCFEGIRVRTDAHGSSAVDKLDRHLARMTRSAAALGIAFDAAQWQALVEQACAAWTDPGEAAMKLVLTRGPAATGVPSGFLTIVPLAPEYPRQRRDGLSVITLTAACRATRSRGAPWLLGGVKTLSYAVNMAAQREAERRGADDVIFVSTDGFVLEAPTGSVVWAVGRTLCTTPTGATGILGGTTQQLLFDAAGEAGFETRSELVTPDDCAPPTRSG